MKSDKMTKALALVVLVVSVAELVLHIADLTGEIEG